jgi:predicted enzyme related to lactoylglutathione lyase
MQRKVTCSCHPEGNPWVRRIKRSAAVQATTAATKSRIWLLARESTRSASPSVPLASKPPAYAAAKGPSHLIPPLGQPSGSIGSVAFRSMSVRWYSVVVDCRNPSTLARFWAEVLGYRIVFEEPDEVVVSRDEDAYPALVFVSVPESKTVKNRLHIDLAPDDRDAAVERLKHLGARPVDIGQGPDVTWVVLADPEGNEFCVLSARRGGV